MNTKNTMKRYIMITAAALAAAAAQAQSVPAHYTGLVAYSATTNYHANYLVYSPESLINNNPVTPSEVRGANSTYIWVSAAAAPGSQAVWFDLDPSGHTSKPVAAMKIWNYNSGNDGNSVMGVRLYDVLVSDDSENPGDPHENPANWDEVPSLQGVFLPLAPGVANYTGEDPVLFPAGMSARWVALRINANHGHGSQVGLSQVRFYDTPFTYPPTPLPTNIMVRVHQAFATSYNNNSCAAQAVNGSGLTEATQAHTWVAGYSREWCSFGNAASPTNQSVWFDFGSPQPVAAMKIWNSTQSTTGVRIYDVLLSNAADPGDPRDPTCAANWTPLLTDQVLPFAPLWDQTTYTGESPVAFPANTTARWVALRIKANHGNGSQVAISEVRFYNATPASPPITITTPEDNLIRVQQVQAKYDSASAVSLVNNSGLSMAGGKVVRNKSSGGWNSTIIATNAIVWFDFGAPTNVAAVKIWNHNSDSPRGVRLYDVLTSTTADPGDPLGDPTSNNWTTALSDQILPFGMEADGYEGEMPLLLPDNTTARWVAIRIRANHGYPDWGSGSQGGLSGVRFYSATPDESKMCEPFLVKPPSDRLRVIQVFVTSNTGNGGAYASHLADCSGLTTNSAGTLIHAKVAVNDNWLSTSTNSQSACFGFRQVWRVRKMQVWNYNDPANLNRGMKDYTVYGSAQEEEPSRADFGDAQVWTPLASGTFSQATGQDDYEGEAVPIPDSKAANVKWVAIRIHSNYGAPSNVGLCEVVFWGRNVPPPEGTLIFVR